MTETVAAAALRRAIDVTASAIGLVVLSPVMAAIAVRIKQDSPGPVIFAQQRVGRHGRPFTIYKFRTMQVSAPGPSVTATGDPRVTRVGMRLRATKLDELPQLVNVLRGDMSLVGPRPEVPDYVDKWPHDSAQSILSVRPGITDPVTLSLRDEERILAGSTQPAIFYEEVLLPSKAKQYTEYVGTRSISSDIRILAQTAWALRRTRQP